jgi:glycosyltransferase involved in cell wall biosynthesis
MKVAILTPSASRNAGGLFNSVRRGAIEIERQGVSVRGFAPEDANCAVDLPFWAPVEVSLYPTIGPAKFGVNLNLRRQIGAYAPDIVHLHGLWTFQSMVSRASREPVVISPRGMLDVWALKNSGLKKRIALRLGEAANLRRAACFHALNRDEAEAIRAFGITAPVAIIPNGIDLPEAPSPAPQWLPSDGRRVLLFLGRIHAKKGVSELIRAWVALRETAPDVARAWRLVVGGWDDGGQLDALKRLVTELHIDSDVIIPGAVYHDEKHALMSHSDAFILPSYSEGLPMSVLEAWAYGLPVFMTRHCNLSFAFAEGGAIEVTTEPDQITATLAAWLGQAKSTEVGAKGRAIAVAEFGWSGIAARQIEMYDWLLGNRARPDFIELCDAR